MPNAWATVSGYSRPATGRPCPARGRCERPWTGATGCSKQTRKQYSAASRCSPGGFTLEAAEGVCSGEGIEKEQVLDLLSRLVERSLITAEERDARARYRLLETIRQYASENLRVSGGVGAIGRRHADHFVSLAEEAETAMAGPGQTTWMARLGREHDNLRAALGWLRGAGEAERGLRLASALLRFWWFGGYLAEGRSKTEALLDLPRIREVPDAVRAKALRALGVMIYRHADPGAGDADAARAWKRASGSTAGRGRMRAWRRFCRILAASRQSLATQMRRFLACKRACVSGADWATRGSSPSPSTTWGSCVCSRAISRKPAPAWKRPTGCIGS